MPKIIPPPGTDPNPPEILAGKEFALREIAQIRKQLNALEKCIRQIPDWKGKAAKTKKK